MPCPFIDQRERSNEELKSKGRREQERQWESKVKSSSVLQNICKGMASFWKGVCYCLLFTGGHELNKGTLVYRQAEGQSPPGEPLNMIYNNTSNEK